MNQNPLQPPENPNWWVISGVIITVAGVVKAIHYLLTHVDVTWRF